jgi:hypothetical protein
MNFLRVVVIIRNKVIHLGAFSNKSSSKTYVAGHRIRDKSSMFLNGIFEIVPKILVCIEANFFAVEDFHPFSLFLFFFFFFFFLLAGKK